MGLLKKMKSEQESEIIVLREKGLTGKQIARKLGLKASEVNRVIKANASEKAIAAVKTEELAPIARCLFNRSSAEQLLGKPEREEDEMMGGLGMVLVARTTGYKRFVVCSYMVDYWCLGLKDTIGIKKLNDIKYRQFLERVYQGYPEGYQEISLEQAQAIVYGAIDYAENLGFKPHKDFEKTQAHLGKWSGKPQLTFGRQGKPFYIAGPYDNSDRIMQTLKQNVGKGNFDYLVDLGGF